MHYLSASLSIILLLIVVNEGVGQLIPVQQDWDQIAQETRPIRTDNKLFNGPTYVNQTNLSSPAPLTQQSSKPDLSRPPSKPPIPSGPNIQGKQLKYVEMSPPRPVYYTQQGNIPPGAYNKQKPNHMKPPHGPYKYPKGIPLNGHHRHQYYTHTQGTTPGRQPTLVYAASSGKPVYVKGTTSPKFSIPVQTVNGIRSSEVRPPRTHNTTTSTTTTTTVRPLRNKRIWPKHILDKMKTYNDTKSNLTVTNNTTRLITNITDNEASPSIQIRRYVARTVSTTTTSTEATNRAYKRVNRRPTHRSSTASPINATSDFRPNDWVPIVPQHYTNIKRYIPKTIRRSDSELTDIQTPAQDRRMLYLHSLGLVPVQRMPSTSVSPKKMMVFFRKPKRQLNPNISSSYRRRPRRVYRPHRVVYGDHQFQGSGHPRVLTKIKHHHHHHHHKYIKTVEKPVKVPYKVEVPKPYPVPVETRVPFPVEKVKIVERKVPFAVPFEKRVPYPVQVKVPQPFPVKVVEKEYVPKPYPVVQQVPVIKHIQVKVPQPVPVQVEKQVPYPVHVKVPVPVDRPVPVAVPYEKKVHVPVPVRILVPQPYPVEKKVPYPVEVKVKEPVEVIRHIRVPVRVPVPHPFPIKVPQPVPITIEKKVPYPVEVEKKVPVPFKVYVPQRVEVEKKVPVYIPKPYPVEKRVAVPFKVQVPVKVPVKVPFEVPVPIYVGQLAPSSDYNYAQNTPASVESSSIGSGITINTSPVTQTPHHTVTVHGNGGFTGFSDRSDTPTTTSTPEHQ